jgi:Cu/Ag efflux protein CusF
MKKLSLLLCGLFVVAGVASAAQATAPAKPAAAAKAVAAPAAAKTHVVEAEVVSADVKAKTLTVKTDKGEATMKVDAAAATHLKALKAGEKVKLTCRDNDKGEHEAISHIKVEKAATKK